MNDASQLADLPAEQLVLGALFAPKPAVFHEIRDVLHPEHFADPIHGLLFREVRERVEAGYDEDQLYVDASTHDFTPDVDRQLAEAGGLRYLREMVAHYHGEPVAELAARIIAAYERRVAAAPQDGAEPHAVFNEHGALVSYGDGPEP